MWVVFEDAEKMKTSQLLKKAYNGTSINVGFAGGCGNVYNYLTENCNEDDRILVYHDLVPDNPDTAKNYKGLRKHLRHWHQTYIIPVVCTEYALLRSFGYVPTLSHVLFNVTYPEGVTSAEQYYKYFIGKLVDPCKSTGKFRIEDERAEAYYTEDCPCEWDNNCLPIRVLEKSIKANRCFPVVPAIKALAPFNDVDVHTVIRNTENAHNDLVNRIAASQSWSTQKKDKALINTRVSQ